MVFLTVCFVYQSNSDSETEVGSEAENEAENESVECRNKRKSDNPRRLCDVSNTSTPKRPHSSKDDPKDDFKGALGETNKLLSAVLERMDKQDKKMERIEKKLNTSVSSSSSSTPVRNRQKEVPLQVRVSILWPVLELKVISVILQRETRRVYAILEEEDPNFKGWSIGEK